MAAILQLRRGSGSIDLSEGELYLNNGVGSIQFGSGSSSTASVIEYTLLPLNTPVNGNINLVGDISASNLILTGHLTVAENITFGGELITFGNSGSDNIVINADLSSSIIPNDDNAFDLGASNKKWKKLYAVSASIDNILVPGSGILSSSNTSFATYTGSVDTKNSTLANYTTSVDLRLSNAEWTGSNHEGRVDLLEAAMSGSNRLYVSPSGSDVNNGTQQNPFRTIKAAVESLGSAVYTNTKRYTIFVGSGEYTEQNPIALPPGVAIVGDTLRTVRLTAANPRKDYFHCHDGNYFYGLRFLNLQNPSFAFSYPCSTATGSISAGGISSIGVVHSMTGYTDGNNQDLGIIIEGPDVSGSIATATANVVGGVITQINVVNGGTNYSATEKPHISIPAPIGQRPVIGTSPYIQNCSSITGPFTTDGTSLSLNPVSPNYAPLPYNINDVRNASNAVIGSGVIDEQGAGGGIRIDGNLVHPSSPLESFVADAFTQVNQGGPGHLVINKGYAQFVSCFTTFCTYGFKTANGGFANISNSVIDFGKEGLVSKKYFPQTYNSGSSLQTLTSTVVGAVIDQDGAGYTGSVATVTISGGGASVQATAEATINANGSVNEIVILTPGSGYTSQPTLTIAAPTGPGAIQATTIAGKANISGIAAILFQLESGSRGVDVSSNMILSGTDYLVTNVATGSSANERYVTVYPAPPSITTGDNVYFHQLSNISTGGLVLEYVGSGVTYNALPKFGGVPNRTKEIIEYAPGRVFYSTVDNIGNLKIGDFFAVNQLTGEVTIDANQFNLSGLSAIGPFKRNGVGVGVVLNEVSNNATLLNAQGITGEDTVPTQYAVKGYVDTISGSLDGRLDKLEIASASLNTFSSSALIRLSNLETTSGSSNIRLNNLESKSASVDISITEINSYTGSQDTKNTTLGTYTGSVDTKWETLLNVTASVLSYTQSLKNAITVTGENAASTTTIKGNLIVEGTQTSINSTAIVLGDNIIELNGTGVANGGLLVIDPTGASNISGSLLWNSSNDYWIGGKKDLESKILLAGGDGIVSSSAQVTSLLPPGVVSGSSQVTGSLDFRYLNHDGDNVVSSSAQIANLGYATTGSNSFNGNQIINGNVYLTGSIIPSGSAIFDLGTETNPFRHLYASSGSIYMDGTRVIGAETRPVKIGDTHEGGIVFYIDSNSHCLIIDSEETGRAQSQYLQIATGATGTAIGTGQSNTNLIMARSASVANDFNFQMPGNASHQLGGEYYGLDGEDPAYVCHNLTKGGFSDWFLPSVDEMKQVGVAIPSLIYQGFVEERYHWTSTINLQGSGQPYSYYTVDGSGRTGRPLRDGNNGGSAQIPFRAIRRSTNLTVVGGLTLLTNTTYSGSITTLDGLVNGVNISASFDLTNERLTELESSSLNLNIVSSSLNSYTASASGRLNNIEAATSSYETKGRSIVSGSSQITYSDISSIPAGIVSGSSQTILNLPTGVVSGSNQLTSSYNLLYAPSASFATLLGANTLASLGSAAFYYVTSSADIALVSGSITYINNHLLTAGATKKYIDWRTDEILTALNAADITAVNAGSGLSGGGTTGAVTLTLDTGSAHFTNGVDARLIPLTSLNSYTGSQNTKNSTLATYTASIDSHISNLNQATSSYETNGRGIISGSTQVAPLLPPGVVSGSSQIIYTSISSIPSGIISGSSQLDGTSIANLTITNLTTVNQTASVIFSSGSNKFGDFNNDTHEFTGSVKITGSIEIIGASTATSFNGAINATNGVVSGSSQVSKTLQEVTTAGASTSNAITITNATASITTGTGALVITGGIGLGGSINAGGDIIAYSSSDIRLKNNIRPISNPLEKISKIGGYNFEWNSEMQNTYIGNDVGVIAQEIETILPELVQTRENGYKAVKYDKLVALLIEGIKELTKQVEYLKTKIEN